MNKLVEIPTRKKPCGRTFDKKYDSTAAQVTALPSGKALPIPVPEGKKANRFKHNVYRGLRRRGLDGINIEISKDNKEIFVWLSQQK